LIAHLAPPPSPNTFLRRRWANNLAAARAAPGQRLLKLDCDTVVTSDFVEAHPPAGRGVYSSDWAAARDENEVRAAVAAAAGRAHRRRGEGRRKYH
jgi:hypothetical protein